MAPSMAHPTMFARLYIHTEIKQKSEQNNKTKWKRRKKHIVQNRPYSQGSMPWLKPKII
jgi:hypothetical protein